MYDEAEVICQPQVVGSVTTMVSFERHFFQDSWRVSCRCLECSLHLPRRYFPSCAVLQLTFIHRGVAQPCRIRSSPPREPHILPKDISGILVAIDRRTLKTGFLHKPLSTDPISWQDLKTHVIVIKFNSGEQTVHFALENVMQSVALHAEGKRF